MRIPAFSSLRLLTGNLLALACCCCFSGAAAAQEFGEPERFGENGRAFSVGQNDYYLLSRRSYISEDSRGYEGQIRQVKKYPGGGYEIKIRDFLARCVAPFDNMTYVIWFEPGEQDQGKGTSVDIKNPASLPSPRLKDSYNLYWAACRNTFGKFK